MLEKKLNFKMPFTNLKSSKRKNLKYFLNEMDSINLQPVRGSFQRELPFVNKILLLKSACIRAVIFYRWGFILLQEFKPQ